MSLKQLKNKILSWGVSLGIRQQIPLLSKISPCLESYDDHKLVVKVPLKKLTANPYKSMYFGALSMGAEMAAGLPVMLYMRKKKIKVSMVMRDVQGEFIKAARADVHFCCAEVAALNHLVDLAIETGKRQQLVALVEARCPSLDSELVAKFAFTVSVKAA
ncbi:YiiD C-terminal domain-containing protein [Pelagibaculum spongiae]|uniref:Thioesterase putative domain-containing protein n=1 Tax=Pelagibaculum spongiae TaxID=2080658 RepID=A0A2V1GP70_9GAMM|nr:YiiD C-terminal domain-containing protein [Pelagibaculum spongiae]PVZ64317.1 hypothetical protein DC094_19830 [Pelagibaculum spongiae]